MALRDFLPTEAFRRARGRPKKKVQILDANDQKVIVKLFKSVGLAIGFTGGTYTGTRINFEPAPYNFVRIIQANDTDSYIKQAFNKYKELLWKEGYDFTSENIEALDYLHQRIDFVELAMKQSFHGFLVEVGDQLTKFANVFLVKVRGNLGPYFPYPLHPSGDKRPVVGYQLIAAETMEVMRDYHNNVILYRQNIWGANAGGAVAGFGGQPRQDNLLPTWRPEEVIHLAVDRKPGRIFGTPFITAVIDDVVALRQIEEDLQNLVHRELFPLYKYKVGTELMPAEPEEIEQAAKELENLRSEGGLVLPDRHDVEVIGSDGKVLDAAPYLAHFKERVVVGLGLSPHHLGMMSEGVNRAVTDRLDISLYDKVKHLQKYIAQVIRLEIFNELLVEGGFDPYKTPTSDGTADRCLFKFNEIDVDSQAKIQNLTVQKWTSDLLEQDEARIELGMRPEIDEDELYAALAQRMTPSPGRPVRDNAPDQGKGDAPPAKGGNIPGLQQKTGAGGANNAPRKPDAALPSSGGVANKSNKALKQSSNVMRPANQHGRRTSPNIRHSDDVYLNELVSLINDDEETGEM